MKVGFYYPLHLPYSLRNYTENVVREMKGFGIGFIPFTESEPVPENIDLLWDPRGGRGAPPVRFASSRTPFVATFHGAAHLALPLHECFEPGFRSFWNGFRSRRWTYMGWGALRHCLSGVIAVSEYARTEFVEHMGFTGDKVFAVHHGVDLGTFYPGDAPRVKDRFILHVSSYQPKKNVKRIIDAYHALDIDSKPRLLIVSPDFPERRPEAGIEVNRSALTHEKLRQLYQKALLFVFPSLHETFGMPILEAMACGCPVITSNVTACPEVAGNAALLIAPRSVKEISEAMGEMISGKELRETFKQRGIERAKAFTWRKSAEEHVEIFEKVIREYKR